METFLSLTAEKRNAIINAGLAAFGKNGYRKCSVRDIASLAGIAKSMIFHYFGTKKRMYFFLIEFVRNAIVNEVVSSIDSEPDFFERIRLATVVKIAVLKRYPCAVSFIKSFCLETDREVADDIKLWLAEGFDASAAFALRDIDRAKFKPGVDPVLVLEMLHGYSEGFLGKMQRPHGQSLDDLTGEFLRCLNMLRQNLYKEEWL